jgi:hypothetical protein
VAEGGAFTALAFAQRRMLRAGGVSVGVSALARLAVASCYLSLRRRHSLVIPAPEAGAHAVAAQSTELAGHASAGKANVISR